MICKICKKRSKTLICSDKCRKEYKSLCGRETFAKFGKDHYKHKNAKISVKELQAIWPKDKKAYENTSIR
jgi:hypothetical protein